MSVTILSNTSIVSLSYKYCYLAAEKYHTDYQFNNGMDWDDCCWFDSVFTQIQFLRWLLYKAVPLGYNTQLFSQCITVLFLASAITSLPFMYKWSSSVV